jgi:glutathione S-transferase
MPVDPGSPIEIVTFDWVPDFARGHVRDFRVRWALEEAGIGYRTRPISAVRRPAGHFADQPFGQVPAYRDGAVRMFAALNSIEPMLFEWGNVNLFARDEEWAKLRRPSLVAAIDKRLGHLADALGDRDYLEARFTAGDLLMASALRALEGSTLLDGHPTLAAYQRRCLARPGCLAAIGAQLAELKTEMPHYA